MSKHTPGPWAFSTSTNGWSYTINIFQADNATPTDGWSDVGYIIKTCEGEQQAIQHANARLIAAAPELLEALKDMLDGHEDACTGYGEGAADKARAAIAKATGGEI
jgi:hypothetical protein